MTRAVLALAGAVAGLLAAACDASPDDAADETPSVPVPLVDATMWTLVAPADDVFADMRPETIDCDPDRGLFVEHSANESRLEINTGWCNYATVVQPLRTALAEGDTVEVRVYHFELTGGPAEAYLAIALQEHVPWEQVIPIPSEGQLLKGTFEVTEAIDAHTPIQFHVHNHGVNSWELVSIDRL